MAKIVDPLQFSTAYDIQPDLLTRLGVLDPTLNVDVRLFVDPLLLADSQQAEMKRARVTWQTHFSRVIELLAASRSRHDVAWRNAERLLTFPEVKCTCLGYGAASISGSGSGKSLRADLMQTAKQIVDLGVTNPDLFAVMALFEEGMGPDRISDMTSRVIWEDLVQFNHRILRQLKISPRPFTLYNEEVNLAANPRLDNQPVLLVPLDVLRSLPIVKDWEEVSDAAYHNDALRHRVNRDIGNIWSSRTRKDKSILRDAALRNKQSFDTVAAMLNAASKTPYDYRHDPVGELFWRRLLTNLQHDEPLKIEAPGVLTAERATQVVEQILDQFQHLIEKRRFASELYRDDRSPRPEKSAQKFFFAVADSYCKANNLDITPEADTGAGSVDFKFAAGYASRVLVEIKLSTNPKLVDGLLKQIAAYDAAENAFASFYVVIDVGHMGRKDQALLDIKNSWRRKNKVRPPELKFIDGSLRPPASKLRR